ncbi:MAG: NAD(P)/FAD-dependent oxidoreductase [Desulfovibrionaceae bacterium]
MHVKYLIIGAGPTGLGAGRRLLELGEKEFVILERHPYVGGLAASFRDAKGFTWDIGGHVVFSHYDYFDKMVAEMLGGEFLEHQRVAMVRIAERWMPYPFQNNIRHLPREMAWECVEGLLNRRTDAPANFAEWIEYIFGAGIARQFMRPYNFKVWATPAERMAFQWIGERVSVVNLEMVLKNLILELDNVSWGPNNLFKFPLHGGTGRIFTRLGQTLDGHILGNRPVVSLDAKAKSLKTADGYTYTYDHLLNTTPVDMLITEVMNDPREDMRAAAANLAHNSVYVAGVGVEGYRADPKCWMYFPEDNCPFYRLTNFHNYSPNNAAYPGKSMAFMAESSASAHKPEKVDALMDKTIDGLVNTAMIEDDEREDILSTWDIFVDYGYPVPTLERDAALATIQPYLESLGISSRGRFGGWKYEVSNMDHSVMQGVEWAERMVQGKAETTYVF